MTLSPSVKIISVLLIVLALAGVVMAAIAADRLGDLVLGLGIVGLIVIILASIGVLLFGKWGTVKIAIDQEHNRHTEEMFKHGALPSSNRYKLLPKPQVEYDVPVDTSGETATSIIPYRQEAIELVALSVQWHQSDPQTDQTQIAPERIAKKLHEYFRGSDGFNKWQQAIKYLQIMRLADERKQGQKSLGTFAHEPVQQLYARMKSPGR